MMGRKEGENKQSREGRNETPQERKQRKVIIFARIGLNRKEAKIENMHTYRHTIGDFYSSNCISSFTYTVHFNESHTVNSNAERTFLSDTLHMTAFEGPKCPGRKKEQVTTGLAVPWEVMST